MTTQIKEKDRKLLWGRAAGKCSICKKDLSIPTSNTITGEEAHIVAESYNGPRADSSIPKEKINSYDNLILVCANHHAEIDKDEVTWTVEKLHKIKRAHEQWVKDNIGRERLYEIEGKINVIAEGGDEVIGADIRKPTRLKAGTEVNVKTRNVKKTTGLRVGGE